MPSIRTSLETARPAGPGICELVFRQPHVIAAVAAPASVSRISAMTATRRMAEVYTTNETYKYADQSGPAVEARATRAGGKAESVCFANM
jgi:hypothetical protein